LIAIFDYGSGNLRSAQRAFALTGHETIVTRDLDIALASDGLVVPGVGAYAACMEQLIAARGDQLIKERVASEKPIIGICVGMQILFSAGSEKGGHLGVGIFVGDVTMMSAPILPHIGWNNVVADPASQLFEPMNSFISFTHLLRTMAYRKRSIVGANTAIHSSQR